MNVYEIQWIPTLFYVSEDYYCFEDMVNNDIFSEEANRITPVGKNLKNAADFFSFFELCTNNTFFCFFKTVVSIDLPYQSQYILFKFISFMDYL